MGSGDGDRYFESPQNGTAEKTMAPFLPVSAFGDPATVPWGAAENSNPWQRHYQALKSASDQGHMQYLMNVLRESGTSFSEYGKSLPEYWRPLLQETRVRQPGITPQDRMRLPLFTLYNRLRATDNPNSPQMQALKLMTNNLPSLGDPYVGQPQNRGAQTVGGRLTFDEAGRGNIMLAPIVNPRNDPGIALAHETAHKLGGNLTLANTPDPTSEGFAMGFERGLYGDLAEPKHSYDTLFGEHPAYQASKELGMNAARQVLSGSMPDPEAVNRALRKILGQTPFDIYRKP